MGLTQREAAQKLKLWDKAIIRLEAGDRKVTTAELEQIAELYRLPVKTLIERLD